MTTTTSEPDRITVEVLVRLFGVSADTIMRWVHDGVFPLPDGGTWSTRQLAEWATPWIDRVDDPAQAMWPVCPVHETRKTCPCGGSEGEGDFALGVWTCNAYHYEVAGPTRGVQGAGSMNCSRCGRRLWLVRHIVVQRPIGWTG